MAREGSAWLAGGEDATRPSRLSINVEADGTRRLAIGRRRAAIGRATASSGEEGVKRTHLKRASTADVATELDGRGKLLGEGWRRRHLLLSRTASDPADQGGGNGELHASVCTEAVSGHGSGGDEVLERAWKVEVAIEAAHELDEIDAEIMQPRTKRSDEPPKRQDVTQAIAEGGVKREGVGSQFG